MKRKELVESREYWIAEIQLNLFEIIQKYLLEHNMTQTQFAEKLGVTKGYVSQILNGDFDHKISKMVDLSLAVGQVPIINFRDIHDFMGDEICGMKSTQYSSLSLEINMPKGWGNPTPMLHDIMKEQSYHAFKSKKSEFC